MVGDLTNDEADSLFCGYEIVMSVDQDDGELLFLRLRLYHTPLKIRLWSLKDLEDCGSGVLQHLPMEHCCVDDDDAYSSYRNGDFCVVSTMMELISADCVLVVSALLAAAECGIVVLALSEEVSAKSSSAGTCIEMASGREKETDLSPLELSDGLQVHIFFFAFPFFLLGFEV